MNTKKLNLFIHAGAAMLFALATASAQAATPYVSATVSGELQPGVYGRIDIGNAPPPPLIYAQPVIIQRPAVYVRQEPLYLHVPPGHAKKWSKHCSRYNACGYPVYFVRVNGDEDYERRAYDDRHHGQGRDKQEYKHEYKQDKQDKHDKKEKKDKKDKYD